MCFYYCYYVIIMLTFMLFTQRRFFPFFKRFLCVSGLNHFMTLYYSGVKNADEAELRQVASEPVDLNVYNVNDFPLLSKLVARLVHILCGRIEERGISKRNLSVCQLFLFNLIRHDYDYHVVSLLLCLQEWSLGPQPTQRSHTPVLLISAFLNWAPEM